MHTARLRLAVPADSIADALRPELLDGPEGTSAQLTLDGDALVYDLSADSVSGLRAALNQVVRLHDVAVGAAKA